MILKMPYVTITPSNISGKKYTATFYDHSKHKIKTTHFGSAGMSDMTQHKNEERKKLYIARHKAREDWNDPHSAGALSRWILWNKPSFRASVTDYMQRFGLKPLP